MPQEKMNMIRKMDKSSKKKLVGQPLFKTVG
jgi:hypothetical protein